jgi:hypothetical protein
MKKILISVILAFIYFSCSKKEIRETSSPQDIFYFSGTVNGIAVNWTTPCNDPSGSRANAMTSEGILSNDCINTFCKEVTEGGSINSTPAINYQSPNGISVYFIQATKKDWDFSEIRTLFNPGFKPFACYRRNINSPVHNGIFISYTDADNHGWDSSLEWGDQDGSSFESVELKDAAPGKPYEKIWKARFSCKLYQVHGCAPDPVITDMIPISGEIYIPVFSK